MNKNITAIAIDDEELCNKALEVEVRKYCPEIQMIGTFTDPREGMQAITDLQPDIVFLDIEMPWLNGFELLDKLQPIRFEVIFVTAYNEYAIKAFRSKVLDYLLKPVEPADLVDAVYRAIEKIHRKSRSEELEILLSKYASSHLTDILSIPTQEGLEFLNKKEIMYCEAEGNYTYIFTQDDKKRLIPKTLKDIEAMINDAGFLRIHQSFLANIAYLKSYLRQDGGFIELKNGKQLPVSRAKKEDLLNKFRE
ncbi:MAG: LytTR family DNA-binding domain-containing protein [Saprospiraceae bacterium]